MKNNHNELLHLTINKRNNRMILFFPIFHKSQSAKQPQQSLTLHLKPGVSACKKTASDHSFSVSKKT